MKAAIRFESVGKSFAGRTVVEDLSFEVRSGEVFALLGPNGAGKTTTVRMLVGIIRPDEGRIEVSIGGSSRRSAPPEASGYLPEDRGLYRDVPVLATLVYFGRLRGLDGREATRRAEEWLGRVGLLDRKGDRLDALSKGNQQRVQLVAALIHRPALAILDEPFSGLDPLSQEFFLDLVRDLRKDGTTVLLSAHQMDLVERVADRVLLMNRGREILSGAVEDLHGKLDSRPRLRLSFEDGTGEAALGDDPDVAEVTGIDGELHVTLREGAATSAFLSRAVALAPLRSVSTESPRLHDVFVRAVRDDDARAEGGAG
jgi:ABC-2 type transport system ATP-binding protein